MPTKPHTFVLHFENRTSIRRASITKWMVSTGTLSAPACSILPGVLSLNLYTIPIFDLGVDADFLEGFVPEAVLTSTDDCNDISEQLQENIRPHSAAECSNLSDKNPSKRLKLSLSPAKPRVKRGSASAPGPMQDLTNGNAATGSSSRFAKPVTSPEREKAAQGVIPSNTEASTQWAVRTFNVWATNR